MTGLYRNVLEPRVKVDTCALTEQLRSCYGLTDSGCSEVREILALAEQDIADYDAEMHRMRLRREELKHYAKQLSSLLSPIRRLPNELLITIFEECCAENDLRRNRPGSALNISAVCTRWRDLSISCPALWSSLKVYLDDENDEEYGGRDSREQAEDRLASTVELYMKRSQTHTLILDIELIPRQDDSEHSALILLAQQSVRWSSLTYRGWVISSEMFPCFDSLLLPLLQTAGFLYSDLGCEISSEFDAAKLAELLSEIAVDSDTVETFSASWNSLACLSYDITGRSKTLWEILDLCPKLKGLTLQGYPASREERSDPPRTLPCVSSFTINSHSLWPEFDTLSCVLSSLTLPKLTKFALIQERVHTTDKFMAKPYPVINDFLARSRCSLTSLTMNEIRLTDKELVSLLLHCPLLQELSLTEPSTAELLYHPISYHNISKSFIQSLHPSQRTHLHRSSEPLVPNLRSVTLSPTTLKTFDSSSFVEMIVSRWLPDNSASSELGVVCLRSVELHLPEIVTDSQVYDPLRRFDAAGMRVVVRCEGMKGYLV